MRLFIAVPLPKDVQRSVFAVQEALRMQSSAGRFVPQGNHHITVRFLGESDALYDVTEAMHEAVCDAKPFLLRLGGYGYFTHGGARTSFIRLSGGINELDRIHSTLESALWERGFVHGRGRFDPHITLGRAVEHDKLTLTVPNEAFWARSIVLYESNNVQGQMQYTPLHTESF